MADTLEEAIAELRAAAEGVKGVAVRFDVDGQKIDLGDGPPQVTLKLSGASLGRMVRREVESASLFMTGDLVIEGEMSAAIAFGQALQNTEAAAPGPVEAASETNKNILYMDNIGLIVLDLNVVRNAYEALGFNLAERGTHFYEDASGDFHRWGTANHCVNFRDGGLLEFIGHYYPKYPAGLYAEQLKAFGNHWGKITIHNASTKDEVARLRRQGHATADPSVLYRYTDGEVFDSHPTKSKRTSLISYPTSMVDSFMLVGAQHTLGDWPIAEEHFAHPNGAQRLAFALIGAQDLTETTSRYEDALSIKSSEYELGRRIDLGRETFLHLVAARDLPAPLRNEMGNRSVATLGAGFETADHQRTRSFFAERRVKVEEGPFGLSIYEPIKGSGAIFFS